MAGVMAGSAILAARDRRETLATVTLTINNVCNLACPHCYLQYEGPDGAIPQNLIDHVMAGVFERVCIVGKEPLAGKRSIDVVSKIVDLADRSGRSASLVTNGLNGHMLPDAVIPKLAWIDVSLDGGPQTYGSYRGGSWEKLCRSVESLRMRGLRELRILQTLSATTLQAIPDMMEAQRTLGAALTIFSPYQATRLNGTQSAVTIAPMEIVRGLAPFAADCSLYLGFDVGYLAQFPDAEAAIDLASGLFGDRFIYVDTDPIDRGIIRVTYDGLVLTPFEAVNTEDYRSLGRPAFARPLNGWFREMRRLSQWTSQN